MRDLFVNRYLESHTQKKHTQNLQKIYTNIKSKKLKKGINLPRKYKTDYIVKNDDRCSEKYAIYIS